MELLRVKLHLAVALPWPVTSDDPIGASGRPLEAFHNIVHAAQAWAYAAS